MEAYQQRVYDERVDLDVKLCALLTFIDSSKTFAGLAPAEQERLRRQSYVMKAYTDILGERIAAFRQPVSPEQK